MLELQGRQHPDHHHLGVVRMDSRVCAGFDVHLDVELSELGLENRSVVDGFEHFTVGHRRSHVPVHQVEFDLHAQQRRRLVDGVSEVTTVEHLLHGVDA
ncbi:Uncharacterised protein [Mycobacteroides abscessus subsp. abscessus]|nr:Uncharacterised protein [Mycobacteroides abscessus subsp. abscessus]